MVMLTRDHCLVVLCVPQWGQWAATRPDLFPQDACTALAALQSQVRSGNAPAKLSARCHFTGSRLGPPSAAMQRAICMHVAQCSLDMPSHPAFPPPVQAPKHAWEATEAAVESSFGAPISELFEEFEAEPVASGSIAQVRAGGCSQGTGAGCGCARCQTCQDPFGKTWLPTKPGDCPTCTGLPRAAQ